MTNEELKSKITELQPAAVFEDGGEFLTVIIEPREWHGMVVSLRSADSLYFDFLFCLTCIDWKTHLTMVYHLRSTRHGHAIVIKSKLDRNQPIIATVCDTWRAAELLEREVYEMFGVEFTNHPDLRLLILPDGWEGKNPLRKDFEDAVNMIKL